MNETISVRKPTMHCNIAPEKWRQALEIKELCKLACHVRVIISVTFEMAAASNIEKTVYLDYNATTPLAPSVLQIIHETLRDAWGNPSSSHFAGKQAKEIINVARNRVATMIGASNHNIVFTSGGTEANNMVFFSAMKHYNNCCDKKGGEKSLPHFITSNIEHDSVTLAIENMVKEGLCERSIVGISPSTGTVDVEQIFNEIRPNTCLISVMMANNESGVIQVILI